ncbi:MAG: hypothetical protein ABIT20_08090 [Gemmatimonadaceae bacterium]
MRELLVERRRAILEAAGATPVECAELLAYSDNRFALPDDAPLPALPLDDEPFVIAWEQRLHQSREQGAWTALRRWMPQLHFPIAEGVSASADYRRATHSGVFPDGAGLELEQPDALSFELHSSPAGRIPVVRTSCRADFEALVCALTRRNEPEVIPASMGACMVSGHTNWQSVQLLRSAWEAADPSHRSDSVWLSTLRMISPGGDLYRDRFILVSDGAYSGIAAGALGLRHDEWVSCSRTIRVEHECAHYLTRRMFGAMTNSLFDELIADYSGIVAAAGAFRADWFLAFMGLSSRSYVRDSGRIRNYRGNPVLSAGAFSVLRRLVFDAAHNVERFDAQLTEPRTLQSRVEALTALAAFSLEELAAADAPERLLERVPGTRRFAHTH